MSSALARLQELAAEYALPADVPERLADLLEVLRDEPVSLTTVRDPREAADVHVADSLSALALPGVRGASHVADLGSGAGFPGLVLGLAMPEAEVALVESVARKCAWLHKAAELLGTERVEVVCARAESWRDGLGTRDLVTARALAPLPVLLEYAAPLLTDGGTFLAYKGHRDAAEEADGRAAADILGLEMVDVVGVTPWSEAGARHLYLWSKVRPTPPRYPRREGMARKRPLRASA